MICTTRTSSIWRKKTKKTTKDGKISHAHGLAGLISKLAFLLKAIYRFNAISIKIPTQFFIELERAIPKFVWNNKESRIAKTVNNKRTSGGICIPDLKMYYSSIVIKTAWYWYHDRQIYQWNRSENWEMNPHMYFHLIFDKETKTI